MGATPRTPGWYLLTRHWLSITGLALIVTAGISLLFVVPQEVRGHADNPYVGIVLFLILPFLFVAGLVLIPFGIYLSKRKIRQGLMEANIDRRQALRRFAAFLAVTTLVNILIGTQLTYRAVKHMETPEFCGASCHTMKPEFAAYQNSPHSRVECVECHVAPGASGWVKSKTNGIRQLVQTVLHSEPKPIPSALESNRLVPSRETCENCHWPDKFAGTRLRMISKYSEDEKNTRTETVLLMLIGGDKYMPGIHGAHFGPGIHIRLTPTDAKRQSIARVEYRDDAAGVGRTFVAPDAPNSVMATVEMQCVDCHNRPTHAFDLPERAMDKAMSRGEIPATLPYIKKEGVALLKSVYRSNDEAAVRVPEAVAGYYRQNYPEIYQAKTKDIERAGKSLAAIYNRNVFPDLGVDWGTYPDNLGHTDFPGCFRCHDGLHVTGNGMAISQDCNTCHEILAMEEASPEILKTLGVQGRLLTMTHKQQGEDLKSQNVGGK